MGEGEIKNRDLTRRGFLCPCVRRRTQYDAESIVFEEVIMTKVIFDAGFHGSLFLKHFARLNRPHDFMYLCGREQNIRTWNTEFVAGEVREVHSRPDCFALPNGSADIVTLNGDLASDSAARVLLEIVRVLKPGGFFIMAHPLRLYPLCDASGLVLVPMGGVNSVVSFQLKVEAWSAQVPVHWSAYAVLPTRGGRCIYYPASSEILERLVLFRIRERGGVLPPHRASTVYDALPGIRVWRKQIL